MGLNLATGMGYFSRSLLLGGSLSVSDYLWLMFFRYFSYLKCDCRITQAGYHSTGTKSSQKFQG